MEAGTQFVVIGLDDTIVLKSITPLPLMGHGCIKLVLDSHLPIVRNETDNKDYARLIKYTPMDGGWVVSYADSNS